MNAARYILNCAKRLKSSFQFKRIMPVIKYSKNFLQKVCTMLYHRHYSLIESCNAIDE
jgi:hypothetical protein